MLRRTRLVILAAAAFVTPVAATAQYPVDNRVGQVDNRVGGELYGADSNGRYVVPNQFQLLPSEERNAIWRSGMLPSEYRLNRTAYGPLPPQGVLNYVTRRSPLQQAMRTPDPQLYNPGYDATNARFRQGDGWIEPTPSGFPQTLQQGVSATSRIPGAIPVARSQAPRPDTGPQPTNARLEPLQPGPLETEPGERGPALPRPVQPTTRNSPSESTNPERRAVVPSLTGAPDRPLPIGEPPPATAAGPLLAR
jgi:hypothetical protein